MNYQRLYEDIFSYLESENIYFAPRKTNRDNKLNQRRWFLGTDSYMCVSFWNGYDHNRKVPNIHLQIHSDDDSKIMLVITSRDNENNMTVLQPIINELNLIEDKTPSHWHKDYHLSNGSNEEIIEKISEFIRGDKIIIDSIISKYQNESISHITATQFEKWYNRIIQIKGYDSTERFVSHDEIVVSKVINRRGVSSLNDDDYIRKILPSKKIIKKNHVKLQKKLRVQLTNKDSYLPEFIFEQNHIDLLVEYTDRVELYEVKPYSTATKNIQYGLGQLLRYYHENHERYNKPISIFIAGPCSPKSEDVFFIKMIQNSLNIDFNYFEIK